MRVNLHMVEGKWVTQKLHGLYINIYLGICGSEFGLFFKVIYTTSLAMLMCGEGKTTTKEYECVVEQRTKKHEISKT